MLYFNVSLGYINRESMYSAPQWIQSDCPAIKMLALVVNPSFGAPAFVARMIPVHNLTTEFLYDKVIQLINSILVLWICLYIDIGQPKGKPKMLQIVPSEFHEFQYLLRCPSRSKRQTSCIVHLLRSNPPV